MKQRGLLGIFAILLSIAALGSTVNAEKIWGITGNLPDETGSIGAFSIQNLVYFDHTTPGTVVTVAPISGTVAGHTVRSIDFRPATGQLYALSTSGTTVGQPSGFGQIYTVNLATGVLTPVGGVFALGAGATVNNDPRAEMEFNPVTGEIRVVTGASGGPNNNFRVNPDTGALISTDSNLAYALGDPNAPFTDVNVTAGAYSNNFAGATSTTFYVWDQKDDTLARVGSVGGTPQSADSGQMFTIHTPAFPGITIDPYAVGMDISPNSGTAYVTYFPRTFGANNTVLATRDLATGAVTVLGSHPVGTYVIDISVQKALTAASVSVTGQVLTSDGRGVVGAVVTLRDSSGGTTYTTKTLRGGKFVFNNVESGRPYVASVTSSTFVYDSQVISVNDSVSGVTFTPVGRVRPTRN